MLSVKPPHQTSLRRFPDQDLSAEGVQTAQTREVAENTRAGTNLGAPVVASDPDVLTYSLSGTDEEAFDINRVTGQLMTKAALDHETKERYVVTVTATDPFGAMVTSEVTITVTDVNEAPMVTGTASIDHAENGTELDINAETSVVQAATYTATDADDVDDVDDAADLRWSLSALMPASSISPAPVPRVLSPSRRQKPPTTSPLETRAGTTCMK